MTMLPALGVGGGTIVRGADNLIAQSIRIYLETQTNLLREGYTRAQEYYVGDHKTRPSDRIRKFAEASGMTFVDNFCEVVVDVLAERLNITGFQSSDDNEELDALVWDMWTVNRMDGIQGKVHTETLTKGDGYIFVEWNEEKRRVVFTPQTADLILPHYDSATGLIDYISKTWTQEMFRPGHFVARMNLYYPERIEKYIAELDSRFWLPFIEIGDPGWPLPWTVDGTEMGEAIGLPIIHFRNKPGSEDFGRSELHSVIPLQDVLNKTLIDLLATTDTMGFPQRWTVNMAKQGTLEVVPGSIWGLQEEGGGGFGPSNAAVGQFEAADPTQLISVCEFWVQQIAGVSRTPQYLFQIGGDVPSGEALKTAESGLVHKADQRKVDFGNSYEDVIFMGLRIQSVFGENPAGWDGESRPSAIWDDSETRNEKSHLESLGIKQNLGVPQRQLWREMGYDADQIEEMEKDQKDEAVAQSSVGAEIVRRFQRGSE